MKRRALHASLSTLLGTLLGVALATPMLGEVYEVTLNSGNVIVSKYEPQDAPYDATKVMIMTEVGNLAALSKSDIASIVSDTEARGFGTVINSTTILIGYSANDRPEPGEEADAAPEPVLPVLQPTGSATLFRDPGDFGGGIPVSVVGGFSQQTQ